jgi:hypothetical protein
MSTIRNLLMAAATTLLFVVSVCAQDSQNKPLGDVAREQREIRKQQQKNSESSRTFTNDELVTGLTASDADSASTPSASPSDARDSQPKEEKDTAKSQPAIGGEKAVHLPVRSALDRPKDTTPDVIIVPAGTELKVDIYKHKTVVPVRVGFATPIPALSQVTVQVSRTYINTAYSYNGMPYVDNVEYATVTAVTVAGTTYEVQTDTVPLMKGGTNSEVTFILGGPVNVLR